MRCSARLKTPRPKTRGNYLEAAFRRFPDIHVTIEYMIAEGDKVVVRNTWRATDRETQKQVEFGGVGIWRIAAGKLAERWHIWRTRIPRDEARFAADKA